MPIGSSNNGVNWWTNKWGLGLMVVEIKIKWLNNSRVMLWPKLGKDNIKKEDK